MKQRVCALVVGLLCIQKAYCGVDTTTLSVENGDCSSYELLNVNKHQQYVITWNGGSIPSYCKFGFIGGGDDIMNQYKVCVEAMEYDVTDCNVEVKYEPTSFDQYRTYSCRDHVPKYCGDSNDIIDIEFDTKFIQPLDPKAGRVTLSVTAKMTYNSTLVIGLTVGLTCLTVLLLGLSTMIYRARRRARVSRQNVYSQPEGISNPIVHPPLNSTNYNTLPPSYDQTMSNYGKMG